MIGLVRIGEPVDLVGVTKRNCSNRAPNDITARVTPPPLHRSSPKEQNFQNSIGVLYLDHPVTQYGSISNSPPPSILHEISVLLADRSHPFRRPSILFRSHSSLSKNIRNCFLTWWNSCWSRSDRCCTQGRRFVERCSKCRCFREAVGW